MEEEAWIRIEPISVFQDFDPGETGILERESAIEAMDVLGAPAGKELVELMDPENNGFVTYDSFSEIALRALVRFIAMQSQPLFIHSNSWCSYSVQ